MRHWASSSFQQPQLREDLRLLAPKLASPNLRSNAWSSHRSCWRCHSGWSCSTERNSWSSEVSRWNFDWPYCAGTQLLAWFSQVYRQACLLNWITPLCKLACTTPSRKSHSKEWCTCWRAKGCKHNSAGIWGACCRHCIRWIGTFSREKRRIRILFCIRTSSPFRPWFERVKVRVLQVCTSLAPHQQRSES